MSERISIPEWRGRIEGLRSDFGSSVYPSTCSDYIERLVNALEAAYTEIDTIARERDEAWEALAKMEGDCKDLKDGVEHWKKECDEARAEVERLERQNKDGALVAFQHGMQAEQAEKMKEFIVRIAVTNGSQHAQLCVDACNYVEKLDQ